MNLSYLRQHYSKQGLWSLFVIAAFPAHVWTFVLVMRDFSWVSERTNAWDAIGVGAYGLLFAFFESAFILLMALLLGFLISKSWEEDKRNAVLAVLVLVASIWSILGQLYFLLEISFPERIMNWLAASGHPLRILYATGSILVAPTVLLPVYGTLKSEKVPGLIQGLADRISTLVGLYLFFDFIGLIIVVIRNL